MGETPRLTFGASNRTGVPRGLLASGARCVSVTSITPSVYKGTSLIGNSPLPLGPPYGPRHMLLKGPRRGVFLVSKVPVGRSRAPMTSPTVEPWGGACPGPCNKQPGSTLSGVRVCVAGTGKGGRAFGKGGGAGRESHGPAKCA